LEENDVVSVISSLEEHEKRGPEIGVEVLDPVLLNYDITTKEIVIINSDSAGCPLKQLGVTSEYGCFVRALTRANINLSIDDDVVVNKGDRLSVTGEAGRLNALAERIGRIESEETETDLLVFSLGILGGILGGMMMIKFGSVSIGMGSAGGLLMIGILFGYFRSKYPAFGGVPKAARHILMEFGLVLFMAGVGLKAGGGIVEGFMNAGPQLLLAGVVITLVPVIIGYFFGRKVLKMNPAILLGSLTGAMTSTPSLNVVTSAAKSEIPALGYAGTYTFANVLLTFAGALLVRLL
jgi:putative transport protein